MSDPHVPPAFDTRRWLVFEHDWLDARLAAAFLRTAGDVNSLAAELATFRLECEDHLAEARRRLFSALDGVDERIADTCDREWQAHAHDVRQAARAVQAAVNAGVDPFARFEVLRRSLRRQWENEVRLLEIVERLDRTPSEAEELVPSAG